MPKYCGFKNRNCYEIALTILSDEELNNLAGLVNRFSLHYWKGRVHKFKEEVGIPWILEKCKEKYGTHTPKGVKWSKTGIREALRCLK